MDGSVSEYRFDEVQKPVASTIRTSIFYGIEIDKSVVGTILKQLSKDFPIPEQYHHLKRVDKCKTDPNRLRVLICPKTTTDSLPSIPSLKDEQIIEVEVPSDPAENKDQFTQGRTLWPINYYPPPPLPSLTEEEKCRYTKAMKRAIELGREAKSRGNAPVGMVILNASGEVVGECGDNRQEMFLDHCCFACIRTQSQNIRESLGGRRPANDDPYLCTNCDVVITREPCVMCSMCLLHSRVRHVIYGCDDPHGGFYSQTNLHYNPKLNHHFRVFRGLMEEECSALWDSYSGYV